MNVAINEGAEMNQSFKKYIDFLQNSGYITPNMRDWADKIRQRGNNATHETKNPTKERAESTFYFTEQLLKLIYETAHIASNFNK